MQQGTTRIEQPWGDRTLFGRGERWPARVDLHLAEGGSGAQRLGARFANSMIGTLSPQLLASVES